MPICWFCGKNIKGTVHRHHPDKERWPDWTVEAHPECHRRYHSRNGHFKSWGGWSSTSGRRGYELAVSAWPNFHTMGGAVRAKSARRGPDGRFLKS